MPIGNLVDLPRLREAVTTCFLYEDFLEQAQLLFRQLDTTLTSHLHRDLCSLLLKFLGAYLINA